MAHLDTHCVDEIEYRVVKGGGACLAAEYVIDVIQ